jgi:hypothetical protein
MHLIGQCQQTHLFTHSYSVRTRCLPSLPWGRWQPQAAAAMAAAAAATRESGRARRGSSVQRCYVCVVVPTPLFTLSSSVGGSGWRLRQAPPSWCGLQLGLPRGTRPIEVFPLLLCAADRERVSECRIVFGRHDR